MTRFTPPQVVRPTGLDLDFNPLNQGIDDIGNALMRRREREISEAIGQAAQERGLEGGRDEALTRGRHDLAFQFGDRLEQRKERARQAGRQAAQTAESARRFDATHKLAQERVEIAREQAKRRKMSVFDQRHEAATTRLGMTPGTPEYKQFMMTGKPAGPAGANRAQNIVGGLNRLATVPTETGERSFEWATGPLQGDTGGAWYNLMPPLARAWGSVMNLFAPSAQGISTTDIRNRIAGDVEALAATIKPLIRGPGEGVWTDADQARLISVIGNLAESNNVEAYYRNLEQVRQRIMANFGIELPQLAIPQPGQAQEELPTLTPEQARELAPGTRFRGTDGKVYER